VVRVLPVQRTTLVGQENPVVTVLVVECQAGKWPGVVINFSSFPVENQYRCGYNATYCGTGCQSNCDAKAECGEYAATPGQKCPINVCCSEFGKLGMVVS
jgi:hypothetical protein